MRTEPVRENILEAYAALSAAEYGADAPVADPAHLRWKFLENPQGEAIGIHLFEDGLLVGRVVAMPRNFAAGERTVRAGYVVDLLLHPRHRGIARLAALLADLRKLPFDLLMATPNQSGIPVWRQLLRFQEPFELDLLAVPLRLAQLASRARDWNPGIAAQLVDRLVRRALTAAGGMAGRLGSLQQAAAVPEPDELDAFVRRAMPPAVLRGVRDASFLRWRFNDSPRFRYETFSYRRGGELLAYVVTRRVQHFGFDAVLVVDVVTDAAMTRADRRALVWGLVAAAAAGQAELLLFLGSVRPDPARLLEQLPFLRVPRSLAPQPVPLFAEWLQPAALPLAPQALFLTLADCDMF